MGPKHCVRHKTLSHLNKKETLKCNKKIKKTLADYYLREGQLLASINNV